VVQEIAEIQFNTPSHPSSLFLLGLGLGLRLLMFQKIVARCVLLHEGLYKEGSRSCPGFDEIHDR
jgi:hypothetical protein